MQKIKRKIHRIDASEKIVGRLASDISIILRGKNKPEFERHIDCGDIVEVFNVKDIVFSGKKLEQKEYFRYSGYQGGLKRISMKKLFLDKPDEVLKRAVRDMLPPVKFRNNMLKRLIIR